MPKGYSENPQTLGEHLGKRRMDLGLLKKDVAKRLGVGFSTLTDWETGRYEPRAVHWPAIIAFLGTDPFPEPGSLTERLEAVRRREGWGQRELALHLGIGISTLSCWYAGRKPWSRRAKRAVGRLLREHGFSGPSGVEGEGSAESVAEHLLARRAALRLTQREAADQIGVKKSTYRGWETRGLQPRIDFWPGVISFLGYDPHPPPRSTAERLRAARRHLGLTQEALGRRLGVTQSAIGKWESGVGPRRPVCRRVVAEFLDRVR